MNRLGGMIGRTVSRVVRVVWDVSRALPGAG